MRAFQNYKKHPPRLPAVLQLLCCQAVLVCQQGPGVVQVVSVEPVVVDGQGVHLIHNLVVPTRRHKQHVTSLLQQ